MMATSRVRGGNPLDQPPFPASASMPAVLSVSSISSLDEALGPDGELPRSSGLPRQLGRRAERAALMVRIHRAQTDGDLVEAARAEGELARRWHKSGLDLREAVRAAVSATSVVPDRVLLELCSSWLEGMGRWDESASLLESLLGSTEGGDLAKLHHRIAELYWRAGSAARAAHHLAETARLDPVSHDALEALAALSEWASDAVLHDRAVLAWHESARRQGLHGDRLGAFDALLRAFDLDPTSALATQNLAAELTKMGRLDAADEVQRLSARAAGDRQRHYQRAVDARQKGHGARSLAALLDGGFDTQLELDSIVAGVERLLVPSSSESPTSFDNLLAELAMGDWLAARLELALFLTPGCATAQEHMCLARLESVGLLRHDQAREALVRAIVVAWDHPEARAALAATAQAAEDCAWPVPRALTEAARVLAPGEERRRLAQQMEVFARRGEGSARMLGWALECQSIPIDEEARRAVDEELARRGELERQLVQAAGRERLQLLEQLERHLAFDPEALFEHLAVTTALLELAPEDRTWASRLIELIDVVAQTTESTQDDPRVALALETASRRLGERGQLAQARFWLRRGKPRAALLSLSPVVDQHSSGEASVFLFCLARREGETALAARALARAATLRPEPIRGLLEAVAAELFVEVEEHEQALPILRSVVRSPANLARLGTLEVALAGWVEPRSTTEIVERTLGVVPPTTQLAAALARAHFSLGEPDLGLTWAQRAVTLRPGQATLRCELLEAVLGLGDSARVVEQLHRLPEAPIPVSSWIAGAASALAWLVSVDAPRALEVARWLLDRVGASDVSFRAALLETARVAHDDAFALEVLERASAVAPDQNEIDHVIMERRWRQNDVEGAIHVALRAVRAGGAPEQWTYLALAQKLPLSPDAELERLELLVCTLREPSAIGDRIRALRELGVARFDLAQDTEGAVAAWEQAAALDPRRGIAVLARDLNDVLGSRATIAWLSDASARLGAPKESAKALGFAAQLALEIFDRPLVLELVERALDLDPTRADLLRLAERALEGPAGLEGLERLYLHAARGVFGVFGERALNYRAARTFDRLGDHERALAHATVAFEAVPAQGAPLSLLRHLSAVTRRPQVFTDSVLRVAERASSRGETAQWLYCAKEQLGTSEEEVRLKFEIGLKLLRTLPGRAVLAGLDAELAIMQGEGHLHQQEAEEELRLALEELLGEADGPDGARLAIAIAGVALGRLRDPFLARRAVLQALVADADVEEFSDLAGSAQAWTLAREAGQSLVVEAVQVLMRPYANPAAPALRAIAGVAAAVGANDELKALGPLLERLGFSCIEELSADSVDVRAVEASPRNTLARRIEESLASGEWSTCLAQVRELVADDASRELGSTVEPEPSAMEHGRPAPHLELLVRVFERLVTDKDVERARAALEELRPFLGEADALELAVVVEQAGHQTVELCRALAHRALLEGTPKDRSVACLHQAAVLAESDGDLAGALGYFRAARALAPEDVALSIGQARLRYALEGFGRDEEVRQTAELLEQLSWDANAPSPGLRQYLLVRAHQALGNHQSVEEMLDDFERGGGSDPYLALLLAERAETARDRRALFWYGRALSHDLGPLHPRPTLALAAAHAAHLFGERAQAQQWVALAMEDPLTRPRALTLAAELSGALDAEQAAGSSGIGSGVGTAREAPEESSAPGERAFTAPRTLEADGYGSEASADKACEPIRVEPAPDAGSELETVSAGWTGATPVPTSGAAKEAPKAPEPLGPEAEEVAPAPVVLPTDAMLLQGLPSPAVVIVGQEPDDLRAAIAVSEAALCDPERIHEWLPDGRRWLRRWPTSVSLCRLVRDAARFEQHASHVAALEHVLSMLTGEEPGVAPPELSEQRLDVDATRALLLRDLLSPANEALALIWDGAPGAFRRDLSDYGVTGMERVTAGSGAGLARWFGEASARLGVNRTALFARPARSPLRATLGVTQPPSVILEGDLSLNESSLGCLIGNVSMATLPEYILLFGLLPDEVEHVLEALRVAFGPPIPSASIQERALGLAEVLWESIRASTQRRLRELCEGPFVLTQVMVNARQALCRAGLYVSGDLNAALRQFDLASNELQPLVESRNFSELCARHLGVLDLFRLATSAEYADVRFVAARSAMGPSNARGWSG